jgi:hypothetical protein
VIKAKGGRGLGPAGWRWGGESESVWYHVCVEGASKRPGVLGDVIKVRGQEAGWF